MNEIISNPRVAMIKSNSWLNPGKNKVEDQNAQYTPVKTNELNNSGANIQKFTCAVCGMPTLTCCSLCKSTFYCSGAHQKLHWYSSAQFLIITNLFLFSLKAKAQT